MLKFPERNSLEFGIACEELSWNHCASTPHRSVTNGTAERAVRRINEGTSGVLLQTRLDEKWWADTMEYHCYLLYVQDHRTGKHLMNGDLRNHFSGQQLLSDR